jgi:type VI secretion system protein ImpA
MNKIATESLLLPVSEDRPAGVDLEYDQDFLTLIEASRGTPERTMGDSVVAAQEPDWRQVLESGTALLGRSKDLRIAVLVTRALLGLKGLPGLQAGLDLIHQLILQFWDGLYPELDASDDNDPTARINVLLELTDRDTLLAQLRTATIIRSRVFGPVSWRDVEVAEGKAQGLPDSQPMDGATIAGAFQDCDLENLTTAGAATGGALAALAALGDDLAERIGTSQLPSFEPLERSLKQIHALIQGHLRTRQPEGADVPVSDHDETTSTSPATATRAGTVARDAGQIGSRDDVVRTLERICDYYSRYEPSSPVPLLLKRAQRLVKGNFVDIIRELAPEALSQIEQVCGIGNES